MNGGDIFDRIKSLLPNGNDYRILDAGTGGGRFIDFLLEHGKVTAIDILPNNIRILKKKYRRNRNINFRIADLNFSIPYKDESFDIVFFAGVIEHLYNPEVALSEINRVLRPAGILLLSTQNSASIKERVLHLLGKTSSETQAKSMYNRHIFFFSYSMLKNLLEKYGFLIQKDFGCFQFPKSSKIFNTLMWKSMLSDTFFFRCVKTKKYIQTKNN